MKKNAENMINVPLIDSLEKRFKLRVAGERQQSFEVTVPREVVLREARRLGIPVEEVTKRLRAVWRYNDFRGLHMELVRYRSP